MFSILALSVKSLLFFQSVFLMWGSGFLHSPSPRGYWPLLETKNPFIPIPSPQPDGESLSKGNGGGGEASWAQNNWETMHENSFFKGIMEPESPGL